MVSSFSEKELLSKVATKSKLSHIYLGRWDTIILQSMVPLMYIVVHRPDKSFYYSYQRPSYATDCESAIRILKQFVSRAPYAGHTIILSISRSRIRRYLLSQFCSDISYWGFPTTPRHMYFHMRSWLDYATMLCLEYHNAVSPPVWSRSLRAAGMNTNTNTNTRTVCGAHKLVKSGSKRVN